MSSRIPNPRRHPGSIRLEPPRSAATMVCVALVLGMTMLAWRILSVW